VSISVEVVVPVETMVPVEALVHIAPAGVTAPGAMTVHCSRLAGPGDRKRDRQCSEHH
jgi:hypothetical protein